MGVRIWLALAGLAIAWIPAFAPPPADPLRDFYTQRPAWTPCVEDPTFECARIEVPLDYADPGGEKITLAVNRLPAADPARRLGSLLTNPGGPGSSGLSFVYRARGFFSDDLRARYDIVGMDPRGVGESSPVNCLMTTEMSEAESTAAYARALAASCAESAGKIIAHVRTPDVARDLDVVRGALGERALHYYGASYGTVLGQFYAHLFPRTVGRMALDSVADTTGWPGDPSAQAVGFETAFGVMVATCLDQGGCPLGKDRTDIVSRVGRMVARLDARPLRAGSGEAPVTSRELLRVIELATYREATWPRVAKALAKGLRGDGSALRELVTEQDAESGSGGKVPGGYHSVTCTHLRPEDRTAEAASRAGDEAVTVAPLFGRQVESQWLACVDWPVPSLPEAGKALGTAGAPPILLVHNSHDAATPVHWARALHGRLDGSVLVVNESGGHGFYPMGPCTKGVVDAFLLRGALPAHGTSCQDRAAAEPAETPVTDPSGGRPLSGSRTRAGPCMVFPASTTQAPLAQSAERLHGKEKVYGSIP